MQCWFRDFLEQRGIDQQMVFRLESPGALQVVTLETVGAWLADLDGDAHESAGTFTERCGIINLAKPEKEYIPATFPTEGMLKKRVPQSGKNVLYFMGSTGFDSMCSSQVSMPGVERIS